MSSKILRRCTILFFVIFALMVTVPMNAGAQEGCQASGSIPLFPSTGTTCGTAMAVDQEKDIVITVQNTSSTTPAPGVPVSAKLVGSITHIMACTTTTCAVELPGTLEFVPGPADGCVSHAVGVLSCAASGNNRVIIDVEDTNGVTLNLTGGTPVATIRVRAIVPVVNGSCGQFGERADTGPNDIVTTDVTCAAVATGAAAGSTNEFFPPTPEVLIEKSCDDTAQICTDTEIDFTVRVTNTGPTMLTSCTVTDPDCTPPGPPIADLAPGAFVEYTCSKAAGQNVPTSNSATVDCTDVNGQAASDDVTSNECTIPPCPPSVDIEKSCDDTAQICTDTEIDFTVRVTNTGPNTLSSCTVTDPDCTPPGPPIADLAPGAFVEYTCSKAAAPEVPTSNSASVSCTDVFGQPANDSDTSNECTIPACPCQIDITKAVALDDNCDGIADGPFVESVTQDAGECVVYNICVTNTGEQILDASGVTVSDAHLGIVNYNFGTIAIGATVCNQVPSVITTATQCPNGTCICEDVAGVNTAVVSAAICEVTGANACEQTGSDCDDTAEVACIAPPSACRMTGGHVNMAGDVDAGFSSDSGTKYTTGGQIGAPNESGCCDLPPKGKCVQGVCTGGLNGGLECLTNDDCPNDAGRSSSCPWGDWEHNHHAGPDDGNITGGSFAFHSGTAAAPDEAFIQNIICADPGWCVQARPAPDKQIFWEGTGVFHNLNNKKNTLLPMPDFPNCPSVQVWDRKTGGSLHYYKAHVGDFGEPAGQRQKPVGDGYCTVLDDCVGEWDIAGCNLVEGGCPIDGTFNAEKTALHPLCDAYDCEDCPDWYDIEIHCTADPESPVIYKVGHFILEGNFQLHPTVGDSCQPCGDGLCQEGFDETCLSCPEDCGPCDGIL